MRNFSPKIRPGVLINIMLIKTKQQQVVRFYWAVVIARNGRTIAFRVNAGIGVTEKNSVNALLTFLCLQFSNV